MDGVLVIGYVISDEDGAEKSAREEDVIKLCKTGDITNAKVINYNGVDNLILRDKLSSLEAVTRSKAGMKLSLRCRLLSKDSDGNMKCVGYILEDESGKKHRTDINKTWSLAFNNHINGVEAVIINDRKILRSLQEDLLENLPVMTDIGTSKKVSVGEKV
jgi:hypothetical protein